MDDADLYHYSFDGWLYTGTKIVLYPGEPATFDTFKNSVCFIAGFYLANRDVGVKVDIFTTIRFPC